MKDDCIPPITQLSFLSQDEVKQHNSWFHFLDSHRGRRWQQIGPIMQPCYHHGKLQSKSWFRWKSDACCRWHLAEALMKCFSSFTWPVCSCHFLLAQLASSSSPQSWLQWRGGILMSCALQASEHLADGLRAGSMEPLGLQWKQQLYPLHAVRVEQM